MLRVHVTWSLARHDTVQTVRMYWEQFHLSIDRMDRVSELWPTFALTIICITVFSLFLKGCAHTSSSTPMSQHHRTCWLSVRARACPVLRPKSSMGRLPWQTLENHRTKGPVKVTGFIFASKNVVSRVPYLKAMVHELVVMVYAAGQTRQPVKASKAT